MNKIIFFIVFIICPLLNQGQNLQILNKANNLLSDNVNAIDFDEHYLWAATNEGIYRIDKSLKKTESKALRTTSVNVLAIKNFNNQIIIGLKDKGLYLLNKSNFELTSLFRNTIGLKTVESILNIKNKIFITAENRYYIINEDLNEIKETDELTYHKSINNLDNFYWKEDSLFLHKKPFLNYDSKKTKLLAENEKYSLIEYNGEVYIYLKEYISLFPLEIESNYKIKQYYIKGDNLLMVCKKGLLVMNIKDQKFTKNKIEVGIASINNKIPKNTSSFNALKNSTLKIKFYAKNLGSENELWIGKSYDKLNYTWQKFNLIEIDVNSNENPIYFKLRNIRGEQSEIIELNLNIKSDFNLNIVNLILALILFLVYTFVIVWFVGKKKNKEIRILEDEIILKTKELQSIKKEKYGLKNDEKII